MKKILILTLLLGFVYVPAAQALSLVYDGFLCQEGSYERSQWIGQSIIEVMSSRDDGMYQLEITGGLINIDKDPCIDTKLSVSKTAGQPFEATLSTKATAYFDGYQLVIIVSRYSSVLSADVFPGQYRYISSLVHTTNQYYFDYDEYYTVFILRNTVTQTDGFVQTFSGMESINPVLVYQRPNEPVILRLTDD